MILNDGEARALTLGGHTDPRPPCTVNFRAVPLWDPCPYTGSKVRDRKANVHNPGPNSPGRAPKQQSTGEFFIRKMHPAKNKIKTGNRS